MRGPNPPLGANETECYATHTCEVSAEHIHGPVTREFVFLAGPSHSYIEELSRQENAAMKVAYAKEMRLYNFWANHQTLGSVIALVTTWLFAGLWVVLVALSSVTTLALQLKLSAWNWMKRRGLTKTMGYPVWGKR